MQATAPTTWLLLAAGDARQYGGNDGYDDHVSTHYQYDSQVANHRRMLPGHLALIRSHRQLLGAARVVSVEQTPGTKEMRRCPRCRGTNLKERFTKLPRYRCGTGRCGHEVESPLVETVPVDIKVARFGSTFRPAPGAITLPDLRKALLRPSDQLAIQELAPEAVYRQLVAANPAIAALFGGWRPVGPPASARADNHEGFVATPCND